MNDVLKRLRTRYNLGVISDATYIQELDAIVTNLERQLAEERANRVGVDRLRESHYELERMLTKERAKWSDAESSLALVSRDGAQWRKRAEAAERRVAELQALVDAATELRFGCYTAKPHAPTSKRPYWWVEHNGLAAREMLTRDAAIALARSLAEKERG